MKVRFSKLNWAAIAAAAGLFVGADAMAVPTGSTYVGSLSAANGLPYQGAVSVQYRLYTSLSGGSQLFVEDLGVLPVTGGRLEAPLGASDPVGYFTALSSSDTVWIEFQIEGEVLAPRQALRSVPYALLALDAVRLGGNDASDFLQQGNVDIQGSLAINGKPVIGPSGEWTGSIANLGGTGPKVANNPKMAFGTETPVCTANSSLSVEWIRFGTNFSQPPIFAGTIDESIDDSGATWTRIERYHLTNQLGLRCESQSDAYYWMAVEPGVHTIGGKKLMAGKYTKAGGDVVTSDAIFFPELFSAPPVVLVFPDVSPDSSGGTLVRVIGTVSNGGFQVWVDSGIDALHWIAMDPGEYNHNGLHWFAGVHAVNNTCSSPCTLNYPVAFPGAPGVVLTIHDTNNNGASWHRVRGFTNNAVQYRINSTTELVNYLLFDN